ncbi:MAG: hypothetical protein AAGI63_05995 [Planctomycetota bacterium]
MLLALGKQLSWMQRDGPEPSSLADMEFQIFSQFGDDGIIEWLVQNNPSIPKSFIEFGVEDYSESNTRFLMMNRNWSGLVLDGSEDNIQSVKEAGYSWRHHLSAKAAFVTAENINEHLECCFLEREVGILHIDIDGNDYWVWNAINCVDPSIVIVEYNANFGSEAAVSVPYRPDFVRGMAHYSNLYFGASLAAFRYLATQRGLVFIGCNSAGNNAYFLKSSLCTGALARLADNACFIDSVFREGRLETGGLSLLGGKERRRLIAGLPVVNVKTLEDTVLGEMSDNESV